MKAGLLFYMTFHMEDAILKSQSVSIFHWRHLLNLIQLCKYFWSPEKSW